MFHNQNININLGYKSPGKASSIILPHTNSSPNLNTALNSSNTNITSSNNNTNFQKNHSKKRKKSNDHTTPSTTTDGANAHVKTKKKQPLNAKMTKPRRLKNKADVDQV